MSTKQISLAGWDEWQQVADGTLRINTNIPISSRSHFEDDVWDFNDPDKPRTLCFAPKALQVNWLKYHEAIPTSLLRSIRTVSFFIVKYPLFVTSGRKTSTKGLAPSSFCQAINALLSFMAELCVQTTVYVGTDRVPVRYVEQLSDITIADIKKALDSWNCISLGGRLQKVLEAFTSPVLKPYLSVAQPDGEPVGWSVKDLEQLDFPKRKQRPAGEGLGYRDKPLSDALLRFMVTRATQDLLWFLVITGQQPQTLLPESMAAHPIFGQYPNFKEIYQAFLTLYRVRTEAVAAGRRHGLKQYARSKKDVNAFKARFNISYADVRRIIERVHRAAKYLLLQFTGLRYSEAAMLRAGCLQKAPSGEYVIRGTVIKGGAINELTNTDYWIAAPIVRDALLFLEHAAHTTQNEYLFAADLYTLEDRGDVPIVGTDLNKQLSEYLFDIDDDAAFCGTKRLTKWRFNGVLPEHRIATHRLRHTLALHMSRAGLGIPYISLHLKHVYQAYRSFQSAQDVTLGYGGIGADIFHNAVGIRQANREIVHSVYHPQAPIAGPGAEAFKQKRAYYFTGMLAAGWQEEDILEHLTTQNLPLADVGLGYCQGRKEIEQDDGSKQLPPCMGQLKCNPNQCKNAVIPASKIPFWLHVYRVSQKRANDPLLAHIREECLHFMRESQQVLEGLGVDLGGL